MKKTIIALTVALAGTAFASPSVHQHTYKLDVLSSTTQSWSGQTIDYPKSGQAKVTSGIISIEKGTSLPWHIHEVLMTVYVLQGTLTIVDDKGHQVVLKEGQVGVESVGSKHRGFAGADKDVKLFATYLGSENLKNTKVVD